MRSNWQLLKLIGRKSMIHLWEPKSCFYDLVVLWKLSCRDEYKSFYWSLMYDNKYLSHYNHKPKKNEFFFCSKAFTWGRKAYLFLSGNRLYWFCRWMNVIWWSFCWQYKKNTRIWCQKIFFYFEKVSSKENQFVSCKFIFPKDETSASHLCAVYMRRDIWQHRFHSFCKSLNIFYYIRDMIFRQSTKKSRINCHENVNHCQNVPFNIGFRIEEYI